MSSHTPGEWQAKDWMVYSTLANGDIAVICYTATNKPSRTPEAKADARLIACAPAMLKDLEWCVQWLNGDDAKMIQATIDKATGK